MTEIIVFVIIVAAIIEIIKQQKKKRNSSIKKKLPEQFDDSFFSYDLPAPKKIGENFFPYQKKNYLFTKAESKFLYNLIRITPKRYIVMGKVRMADTFLIKGAYGVEYKIAFSKIKSKHFDFVIVRESDYSIYAAIELDDSSHNSQERIERDIFVDSLCRETGFKLFRFRVQQSYSENLLKNTIFPEEYNLETTRSEQNRLQAQEEKLLISTK